MARAFADVAAKAGADAVKFQTHLAEEEGTVREQFRVNVFPQDATRQDYWRRTSFSLSEWKQLASYVRDLGLVFLSSPFSEAAVDWLLECEVPAWKLASGEIGNLPLLEKIAETQLPVFVSSGMSSWSELDTTVDFFRQMHVDFSVMQCTSSYPCPPNRWGLNILSELRTRYSCPIGFSDHSGTIVPSLSAVALGANIIEFHLAFHSKMFGPDVLASLTPEAATELIRGIRALDQAKQHPVDKDAVAEESISMRQLFTKSVVAAKTLEPGTILGREHLAFKKPGDGIPANQYPRLLGKRTKNQLPKDHAIADEDLE